MIISPGYTCKVKQTLSNSKMFQIIQYCFSTFIKGNINLLPASIADAVARSAGGLDDQVADRQYMTDKEV